MKQDADLSANRKIVLDNVPNNIDLDTISLIFENYKYCGECDLVSKIETNKTFSERRVIIEYSNESGAQKVLNCKNITYKNYAFKPRLFQIVNFEAEQTEYGFDIESFKYPFYILKHNKILLELFTTELESNLNAHLNIKNESTFTIVKNRSSKLGNEEWTDQIKSYFTHFKRTHFAQKQWNNLEMDMWYLLRDKAISNYGKMKDLFLVIKNEPEDYFIRIEGLRYVVTKAENELNDELTSASSNISRKKMRLSNSINNFIQQK